MATMRQTAFAALLLGCAGPAAAQDLRFDGDMIATCLDGGGGRDCIGAAAEACMAGNEGGYSTAGMNACLGREHAVWDRMLNEAYAALRTREAELDASAEPITGYAPRPSGAEAIRTVQRNWIAYRDASCQYLALQWWGGSGASVVASDCMLTLTAEQALTLRRYLQGDG